MGFPLGYSELLLPKLVLQLLFLLHFVRRAISSFFSLLGLSDLLLDSEPSSATFQWPSPPPGPSPSPSPSRAQPAHLPSISSLLIQQALPVTKFRDLVGPVTDGCAVCLYEFEGGDDVRRPGNCRHVYHRDCLDRWVEQEQRTCPLCRMPLVPEEVMGEVNERIWAAAGLPDSEEIESFSSSSSSSFTFYYSPPPPPPPPPPLSF